VAATTATRAGEQQGIGVAAGRQLPADRLHHQRGQGYLADAGVALGPSLEPAAEPAGLVAGGTDLQDRHRAVEVDAAAAQAGQLAEAQAGAEEGDDMVPPEQWEAGQQAAGFLGPERSTLGLAEDLLGVDSAPERRHPGNRVDLNGAFVHGELEDAPEDGPALDQRPAADLAGELGLPAAHVGWADPLDRPIIEPWAYVQPESAVGSGQRGGAAVRVGGPQVPPLGRPGAER
jgi:hypothetical protein